MENETHVKKSVTQGTEIQKSPFKRALSIFLADDLDSVKDSIVDDYIKPRMNDFKKEAIRNLKDFMVDSICGCVQMVIWGQTTKNRKTRVYDSNGNPVQYFKIYDRKSDESKVVRKEVYDEKFAFTNYKIDTYGEAKEVLDILNETIERFKVATVADYYMLIKVKIRPCDYYYGWLDLEGVNITSAGDGDGKQVILFPRPVALPRNK